MRPGERAGALAVEVALQPVADGLVQQDAGPAGAEHHGHLAGRRGARLQVGQRGLDRVVDVAFDLLVVEIGQAEAPAAAAGAHFAPAVLLGDHRDRQAHQRPHVGRQRAVGARDHHHVAFAGQARPSPGPRADPWHGPASRPCPSSATLAALSSVAIGSTRVVQRPAGRYLFCSYLRTPGARCSRYRPHGAGRVEQRGLGNVVGIGEGGLLAADRPHAHALVDAEAAGLDDALFQAPAFAARVLEVQVGVVDLVGGDFAPGPWTGGIR